MTTRREQILDIIKQRPEITAMQLGDLVDCDVETVHTDIADLVKATQVVAVRVTGKNGVATTGYRLNHAFLGWKQPDNPSSPSADAGKNANASENSADDEQPAGRETKASLAIVYLEQHGTATNAQLRAAMGIPSKYSPSQFLGPALKHGTITRDGDNWSIARAVKVQVAATPKEPLTTSRKPARRVVQTSGALSVPTACEAVTSSMSIGGLQVIHWRAGNLVVSANDNTVDLSPAQVHALRAFVGLMP